MPSQKKKKKMVPGAWQVDSKIHREELNKFWKYENRLCEEGLKFIFTRYKTY